MIEEFDILNKSRKLTLKVINGLSIEQLNTTPKGFNNNIAWNIAHLVVTQQLLCYKFSGLDCLVSDELIENFRKGSSPTYIISEDEFLKIKEQFVSFPKQLEDDYKKGLFKTYTSYLTSVDVTLDSISKAVKFNNYHEGIHLGIILQLRKLV